MSMKFEQPGARQRLAQVAHGAAPGSSQRVRHLASVHGSSELRGRTPPSSGVAPTPAPRRWPPAAVERVELGEQALDPGALDGESGQPHGRGALRVPYRPGRRGASHPRRQRAPATFVDLVGLHRDDRLCPARHTRRRARRSWHHAGRLLGPCLSPLRGSQARSPEAEKALARIGALYELDRRAEGDAARRAELCRSEAGVVLTELKAWLWEQAR